MTNEKESEHRIDNTIVNFYNQREHSYPEWRDFIKALFHSHTQEVVEKIEGMPRYDVYDGGEAETKDGDYIKVSDVLTLLKEDNNNEKETQVHKETVE